MRPTHQPHLSCCRYDPAVFVCSRSRPRSSGLAPHGRAAFRPL